MDITLTLNYGPLDAEFTGEDREELQHELIEFVEFIGEEKETLSNIPTPEMNTVSEDGGTQTPLSGWEDSNPSPESQESKNVSTEFVSLSTKTGVDEETLEQFFELPEDEEGVPSLNIVSTRNNYSLREPRVDQEHCRSLLSARQVSRRNDC